MTSITVYDPASAGTALPELPPLPIGVLVVAAADLLQQAADLPQPTYITVSQTQAIDLLFTPEQASVKAITRWALRFGGIVASEPHQTDTGPQTWCRTDFDYYGVAVMAFAHIPLTESEPRFCPSCGADWETNGDCAHVGLVT